METHIPLIHKLEIHSLKLESCSLELQTAIQEIHTLIDDIKACDMAEEKLLKDALIALMGVLS